MRDAFSLLEFVIVCFVLVSLFLLGGRVEIPSLPLATHTLLSHIQLTQTLALNDSTFFAYPAFGSSLQSHFPSINPSKLTPPQGQKNMWQIQFHLSGKYTANSYSIYKDTPRFSSTTDFDSRPMSADLIAINPHTNQCLSGYNNTNVSDYCKNNTAPEVRLQEQYKIQKITLEGNKFCQEREGGRIFFDDFGIPYCGKSPQKLTKPLKITLYQNQKQTSICILPQSGYAFISSTCNLNP